MTTVAKWLQSIRDRPIYRVYRKRMEDFALFLGCPLNKLSWKIILVSDIERFIRIMQQNGYSPGTVNAFISAIKSYTNWVYINARGVDELFLHRFYRSIHGVKFLRADSYGTLESLELNTLRKLLELIEDDGDHLLWCGTVVIFYLGARPVEVTRKIKERKIDLIEFYHRPTGNVIDFNKNVIGIITAKTGLPRAIPFPDELSDCFRTWLDGRVWDRWPNRYHEWFAKHFKKYKEELGVNFSARKTFRTLMELRTPGDKHWMLKVWMGHKTGVEAKYRDPRVLVEGLREEVQPRHFMFEIL